MRKARSLERGALIKFRGICRKMSAFFFYTFSVPNLLSMKAIKHTLLTGFFLAGFALTSQAQTNSKEVIQSSVVCSHCTECPDCVPSIRSALFALKGVRDFQVDVNQQTITVYYNPKKVDLAAIRTAISKAGFKADNVEADAEAYAKLDGCCKATAGADSHTGH